MKIMIYQQFCWIVDVVLDTDRVPDTTTVAGQTYQVDPCFDTVDLEQHGSLTDNDVTHLFLDLWSEYQITGGITMDGNTVPVRPFRGNCCSAYLFNQT